MCSPVVRSRCQAAGQARASTSIASSGLAFPSVARPTSSSRTRNAAVAPSVSRPAAAGELLERCRIVDRAGCAALRSGEVESEAAPDVDERERAAKPFLGRDAHWPPGILRPGPRRSRRRSSQLRPDACGRGREGGGDRGLTAAAAAGDVGDRAAGSRATAAPTDRTTHRGFRDGLPSRSQRGGEVTGPDEQPGRGASRSDGRASSMSRSVRSSSALAASASGAPT